MLANNKIASLGVLEAIAPALKHLKELDVEGNPLQVEATEVFTLFPELVYFNRMDKDGNDQPDDEEDDEEDYGEDEEYTDEEDDELGTEHLLFGNEVEDDGQDYDDDQDDQPDSEDIEEDGDEDEDVGPAHKKSKYADPDEED